MTANFDLWFWPTPNGRKVTIMLEELGLDYDVHPVNIRQGEQFDPEFLKLNPNNKIPVLRDNAPKDGQGPLVLAESGAILLYLAEREGRFLPADRNRWAVKEWLMFQMSGIGPMHGQANHFNAYIKAENPYAQERYVKETRRLYQICDERLARSTWLAGEDLSVADFSVYPWAAQMDRAGIDDTNLPNLKRWFRRMSDRRAVQRGMAVLSESVTPARMTDAEREILFGRQQYMRETH